MKFTVYLRVKGVWHEAWMPVLEQTGPGAASAPIHINPVCGFTDSDVDKALMSPPTPEEPRHAACFTD